MADSTALTPPADAPPTTAYDRPNAAGAIDTLEKALGGRPALVSALLAVPPSAKLDYVIGLIADPDMDARKLSAICRMGKITVGELLEAFKRGTIARAQAAAIRHVADTLPDVVADLTTRAVPHTVTCGVCDGRGDLPADTDDKPPVVCRACRGSGVRTREPELETQRTVLELAGLSAKAAPSVLIDQRDQRHLSVHDHSPAAHSRFLQAVDAVLYRRVGAGVIDAAPAGEETAAADETPPAPPPDAPATP